SFHTGYNLESLAWYSKYCNDRSFEPAVRAGLDFYKSNFFLSDGTPKYYHDRVYPIDIHCPGQLLVTMIAVGAFKENRALCDRVANWTIVNMQDQDGYFYYQRKRFLSSRISYMRWSNAFMFSAFSSYVLELHGE